MNYMFNKKDINDLKRWLLPEWYISSNSAKKILQTLIAEWEKKPDIKLVIKDNEIE